MFLADEMPVTETSLFTWPPAPPVVLGVGGVALYLAARLATHVTVGPRGLASARGGRVALGQFLPIAAVAITALFWGRVDIAIGVTFAASVASLSLAIGMITFLVPNEPVPPTRRAWPFLLPAAMLSMLAGFGGGVNPLHAIMIAGLGATVLGVWLAAAKEPNDVGELLASLEPSHPPPAEASPGEPAGTDAAAGASGVSVWLAAAALPAVIAAAWLTVYGTIAVDLSQEKFRANLLAAGAVSPLLTLPLLAAGTDMAQRNRSGEACSACVGVALLNLLLLLPLLVLLWWVRAAFLKAAWPVVAISPLPDASPVGPQPGWLSSAWDHASHFVQALPSLPMPMTVWRIDTIVLTVLGFALLPTAMGRWRIRRLEAATLVLAYAAYLGWTAYLVSRVGGV